MTKSKIVFYGKVEVTVLQWTENGAIVYPTDNSEVAYPLFAPLNKLKIVWY